MNRSVMKQGAVPAAASLLVVVDPRGNWKPIEGKIPCLNLDDFGKSDAIKWILKVVEELKLTAPRIIVVGRWQDNPDDSELVHRDLVAAGATYYERARNQTFDEYRSILEGRLRPIFEASGNQSTPQPLLLHPATREARALYASRLKSPKARGQATTVKLD